MKMLMVCVVVVLVGASACIGDPTQLDPLEELDVGVGEDVGGDGDGEPEPRPEPEPEPGDGEVEPEPDQERELYDCDELAMVRGESADASFKPTTARIYTGDPFAMIFEGNITIEGLSNLGLEVVDRANGTCVTHSEDSCIKGSTIYLAHGEAPAAGEYCVFFTIRITGQEKAYRAAAEVTIQVPPDGYEQLSCRELDVDLTCFTNDSVGNIGSPLECKIENAGSCEAGI